VLQHLAGLRIHEDPSLTDPVHDWSQCRSKSRARRRKRMGYKQRDMIIQVPKTTIYRVGDMLVMHPRSARALRQQIRAEGGLAPLSI